MTFWIKTLDGGAVRLKDSRWYAKIYAAGEACEDLGYLLSKIQGSGLVRSITGVRKKTDVFSRFSRPVLEIGLTQGGKARKVAELLENAFQNPDAISLYNVDVLPEQQYYYEKELFPLAHVKIHADGLGEIQSWELLDNIESVEYETPNLRCIRLEIKISDKVPSMHARLEGISLAPFTTRDSETAETIALQGNEAELLAQMMKELDCFDPDLIITQNGDSFVLPYLRAKARKYAISLSKLDRDLVEGNPDTATSAEIRSGKTYFSYGRILYRPVTQRLFGRLHLDEENTFVYDQCRLQGLFEVTRLCRMPIHTSMRASIGKCLSGLQFYRAFKKNLLIPWKPEIIEDKKNGYELFVADRGGLVFNPLPGIHEHVCEIDFASLYPSIIRDYNISAETVNCRCCPDSRYQIKELQMHVCEKRKGVVAQSLILPLARRFAYKRMRDSAPNAELKNIYNERAAALKWILVCCLGKQSPVLIKQRGTVQYVKIGEFIDNIVGEKEGIINCPDDILVAGVGSNFKFKFCRVRRLFKIPNFQRLLNITLEDGTRIEATRNHPFYLLKNNQWIIVEASKLRVGQLLPVAKKLPSMQSYGEITNNAVNFQSLDSIHARKNSGALPTQLFLESQDAADPKRAQYAIGDLSFARITKIKESKDAKKYVYCFQLAAEEVPGFFAGEGAIFTHNCFGYLSYRNAKFGKIDSHIAVCALARQTLLDAMHIAEQRGFRMIHGIVDSLWLEKKGADLKDYKELCKEIEGATGFKLAIEGIYKWIVFLPSKTFSENQVANRYFGCFEKDEGGKVRGIELRRHDTPIYFKKCQSELLKELYKCNNESELREAARTKGIRIFAEFAEALEAHAVSPMELLIRRRLSKELKDYASERQLSVSAASKLSQQGHELKAGQSVSYVITHYKSVGKDRAVPEELASRTYDSRRYVELLADSCATILYPFGVTKENLLARSELLQ